MIKQEREAIDLAIELCEKAQYGQRHIKHLENIRLILEGVDTPKVLLMLEQARIASIKHCKKCGQEIKK
jgi:hypothetical protein